MKEIGSSKEEILSAYEKAYQIAPEDSLIITELSRIYREFNRKEKRDELFVLYPPSVKTDDLLNLARLVYFVDTGQLEDADELFKRQSYSIFEEEITPIVYFTYLHIQKAHRAMERKDYKSAKQILKEAFIPPYNWSCAKGEFHLEGWLNYELARIAEKCKQAGESKRYYKNSVNSRFSKIRIDYYYRYLSARKLKLHKEEKNLWRWFLGRVEFQAIEKEIEYLYEYHLALGYLSQSNFPEAKKRLKNTFKLYPNFLPAINCKKNFP
ncbi:hypothetical protein KAW50_06810, partial [candidate division WOR-3 bacterium]|nr:hypothetical protein [candidate division WOR-3 bacterium]